MKIMKEILKNKKLIWSLAVNDFTTKYSGAYLGVFWAFVQPIVTTMIYVFVFQIGFKAQPVESGYPYVLWLIAGIVPWFYFGESLMTTANCFLEYSYLVKKVVFPISVLPCVKIISGLFIHLFFVAFGLFIFILLGKAPNIYIIQLIYYMICLIALILAISYLISSIVPFFKDFSQIVNLLVQIGMWLTPIMWDFSIMNLGKFEIVFKLNPMFYIVQGYRDAFVQDIWFWQHPKLTVYFWGVTIVIYILGTNSFKKMKPHLADVL